MQHRPTAAAADAALSTSCSALLGQKAFANYNGLVTGLVYCPVPPHGPAPHPTSAAAAAVAAGARGTVPPPWLAIVVDASMRPASLQHAKEGIAQALLSLPPHTRLLLAVVDKVVSFVDLRSPQAPSWVLHSATSKAAVALPHLVRAADIRATPLSHCLPHLPAALAALRHYSHPCTPQLHLHSIASALDIAIYLLTASMAAWDANQRSKADGGLPNYSPSGPTYSSSSSSGVAGPQGGGNSSSSSSGGTQPVHSARVLFLTDQQPRPVGATAAAAATTPMDAKQQQHVQQLFAALGRKADNVDIPIDVITGSPSAASWVPLQDTVITSRGTTLYQPHLAPPLASNLAALATKRVGWEGVIGFQLPRGVKLAELQGPIAPGHALPLFYPGAHQYGAPSAVAGGGGGPHQHSSSAAAAGDGSSSSAADGAAGAAPSRSSRSGVARAGAWPDNAVAVPAVEAGSSFLVQLELGNDLPPGSTLTVEAVAQWTDRAGQRQQQASQLQLSVASRRGEFLSGLHHPTALLLLARTLVEAALTAFQKAAAAGKGPGPRRKVLEEAGLRVGQQLALVAQRLGEVHNVRKGLLGWGSQQVWQLPDELVPMAVALYLLQHGPLLGARRPLLFHPRGTTTSSSSSTSSREGAAALASSGYAAAAGGGRGLAHGAGAAAGAGPAEEEEEVDEEAAWQLQVYQLLDASPEAAVRLAAPEMHVYDPSSAGFKRVLPVSLAITPTALVVVDCGTQLVVYAGTVIRFSNPGATDGADDGGAAAEAAVAAAAAAAGAAGGGDQMPDVAMVAAPAVQLAQALAKGRLPVPSIHIVETEEEVDQLLSLLVPLHLDPMATQLLLLPDLRSRTAAEHGQLLQWHKQRHERQLVQQEVLGVEGAEVPSLDEWCAALRVGLPVDHEGVAGLQL